MDSLSPTQQEYIRGLRDIVNWLEQHPERMADYTSPIQLYLPGVFTREELVETVRALGGTWEKSTSGSFFWMVRKFGPHKVSLAAWRDQICEKVVTVTEEEVTEPDPDILATVPMVTRTIQKETVEWICPESLLADPEADERIPS